MTFLRNLFARTPAAIDLTNERAMYFTLSASERKAYRLFNGGRYRRVELERAARASR